MTSLQEFSSSLKGQVTTEGDAGYDIKRWAKNAVRKAKYVVYPMDAEDVSKAILFAKANKLDLAICGGGHGSSGASSTEGGVVIDLGKKMNGVRIDEEKKLAYVQGGALWGSVDEASMKYGLVALGGVVSHTGVGGLTTGGGYGWLTGQHGLVVDNLVSATVVTANGDVLTASDTENTDLFWAIRGGGSNFGPVTEFVYKLHEQRAEIYFAEMIFLPDKVPQIANEIEEWSKTQSAETALHLVFAAGPGGRPCVVLMGMHNGSLEEGEARFENFAALGPLLNKSRQMPYPEINNAQNHAAEHGQNRLFKGAFVPEFDKELLSRIKLAREKMITDYPATAQSAIIIEFYNSEKVRSVPLEATAYAGRYGNRNLCLALSWTDESLTPHVRQISKDVVASIIPRETGEYGNLSDGETLEGGAEKSVALFGANYPRLASIKKRYDPENVFRKWYNIIPA